MTRGAFSTVLALSLMTGAAQGQPVDKAVRDKAFAGEWKGVVEALHNSPKPTGDTAYWLALGYAHTGNEKGATALLADMHKASPLDRSVTLAVLRFADPWWLRNHSRSDFPLATVDEEVAAEYVRSCARIVEKWQVQKIDRGVRMADSDSWTVASAFEQYEAMATTVDPEVARIAGHAYLRTFSPQKAVMLLEYAAARLPQCWDIELDLALSLLKAGSIEAARAHYATAATIAPKQALDDRGGLSRRGACMLSWGQGLHDAGRYKEAVATFREFLAAHSTFAGARHLLGRSAHHAGDLPLAVWAFNDSLEVESVPESYYYLGRCWFDTEEWAVAKALFERALAGYKAAEETSPNDLSLYLGRAAWNLGQREEAIRHLEQAFALRTNDIVRTRILFQAYIAMEDPYGAIETCRRYGSQTSVEDNRIREEGIEAVLRRWPQPLATAEARAKPMTHTSLAKYTRAQVSFRNFRFREAVEHLRAVMTRRPVVATANGAWALLLSGYPEDAEATAKYAAATQKPEANADEARLCQGASLICLKKFNEAIPVLKAITTKAMFHRRDVALLYASIGAGKPESSLMNAYNAMGIIETAQDTLSVQVLMILPGSPLLKTEPSIVAGQYVEMEGPASGKWARYARDIVKLPVPQGVVGIRISDTCRTTADFSGFGRPTAPENKP